MKIAQVLYVGPDACRESHTVSRQREAARAEHPSMSYGLFPRMALRHAVTDDLGVPPTRARKVALAVVAMTDRAHGEFRTWTPPPPISATTRDFRTGFEMSEEASNGLGGTWVENDRMPKTEAEVYRRRALNALGVALLPDKAFAAALEGYTPDSGPKSNPADLFFSLGGLVWGGMVDVVEAVPYLAASGWFGVRSLYAAARDR
jgi:hypothetical protein